MKKFMWGLIALIVLGFIFPKLVATVLATVITLIAVVAIVGCALLPVLLTWDTGKQK
jgi:hypothetical protein